MSAARVAFLAFLLAFGFDWLAVHIAYGSNWTGLFCAGISYSRPPEIAAGEFVRNDAGYDGQFYQIVAHDPLFHRHFETYIDVPRMRYRRILEPGLAAVASPLIPADWAYYAITWLFAALGTWCMAELAIDAGRPPWWGLLFLATPATMIALDRMVVDVSLSALTLAAIVAAKRQRWTLLWLVLAGALLSKETGILVIAATALWLARERRFLLAAMAVTSVAPALLWYAFVTAHTQGDYSLGRIHFLTAFFAVLKQPLTPGVIPIVFRAATVIAAIAMVWAACTGIALAAGTRLHNHALAICLAFAVFALVFEDESIWEDYYSFARVYSPILITLVAGAWTRPRLTLIPFALVAPVGMRFLLPIAGKLLHG